MDDPSGDHPAVEAWRDISYHPQRPLWHLSSGDMLSIEISALWLAHGKSLTIL
jgi:hypothetical protein